MIKVTRDADDKRPITPDGHHDSASLLAVATALDEVARLLTYETQKGLTYPSDVYHVLGMMNGALTKVPQALQQMREWLNHQAATGRMAENADYGRFGGNAVAAAKVAAGHMAVAENLLEQVAVQIGSAHVATTGLESVD
jgi:hypothetical protein